MSLLKRIGFSLRMLHCYRQTLVKVYCSSSPHCQLHQISPRALKQQGVKVLVLDFDGVLASHGEYQPTPELKVWLQDCIKIFGAQQIFVLSNKPMSARIAYFNQHYEGIRYLVTTRKKPYPDGLEQIMDLTEQPAKALILVDDRLLTGVLAACIAQVPVIYITYPYVQLAKRPIPELFFMMLRRLERLIVWIYVQFK